jgi:hypothetical protein
VTAAGGQYLLWATLGMVPLTLSLVFGSALRAAGDTRTPLAIGAAANLINIALGWALIYGRFRLPRSASRARASRPRSRSPCSSLSSSGSGARAGCGSRPRARPPDPTAP